MNARTWKGALAAVVIGAVAAPAAAAVARERPRPAPAPAPSPERPGTHNMMLVGRNTAFLSHLPMFQGLDSAGTAYDSPHRFQVILEVTFTKDGRDVTPLYLNDRRQHPDVKMYTLNPSPFVLPDLFPGGPTPALARFTATRIFRGHLERPGNRRIPALDGATVNVRRVIRSATFDPAVPHSPNLSYVLFGKGDELFLAHVITAPPDFDQILAVRVDGHTFTEAELAGGVQVTFPGVSNTPARRIKRGQPATGDFRLPGTQQPLRLSVRPVTELYFEEGELRMPDTMDDTPEETRAGF